jgi:hypothetical protein
MNNARQSEGEIQYRREAPERQSSDIFRFVRITLLNIFLEIIVDSRCVKIRQNSWWTFLFVEKSATASRRSFFFPISSILKTINLSLVKWFF